uniref:Uncharacterized protein n=1 Tax=Chromera velia CCMP2878 TaxID=1169474 RepID=A0A0G4I871_9ALVE|eukprot:Cvel_11874.t1-p1 / transcript=Cvel_11874.t1 / gene=Cvel_11874 / organism=Chromera_velia_CCMP2878 / gene_product=hypothetical protein / transcript_product=hypothetical protein / location=Cvel_scaffold758:36082-37059(-) / protein_length=191 / sequence_SO=supercontig / SO=protein_coding / is_pseudo=false
MVFGSFGVKGSALLLVGSIGAFLSLYMLGDAFHQSFECVSTAPSSCTNWRGADMGYLTEKLVNQDYLGWGNYTTSSTDNETTSSYSSDVSYYTSTVDEVVECASDTTFTGNKMLEFAPQRPTEACFLAGCSWRQCLRVTSSCSNGTRNAFQSASCFDRTSVVAAAPSVVALVITLAASSAALVTTGILLGT